MKKCLIVSTVSRQFTLFERGNIKVLKELGYEIHGVANYSDASEQLADLEIVQHHIDIQRSPFSLKNIKAYKQLKKIIETDEYDLIHCHTPMGGVLARIVARKARKQGKTKVIYTAHGFHFFKGAPLLNWLLYYPIEKFLSKYTDCIITINQEDFNVASQKFKAKRVELVNGIGIDETRFDFEMSEKDKSELKEDLGIRKEDFVLICIGELNKNKNQIMAIEAAKKLCKEQSDIKLVLVGTGVLKEFYKKKIKEYDLQDNVQLVGYRRDIPQLLKISNIALSLSHREGLPVNVMEALASNVPVIATDCRGNRDLIENNQNGYIIKINDVEMLRDKILYIYKNYESEQNKLISNTDKVKKYFSSSIMEKMKTIYEQ